MFCQIDAPKGVYIGDPTWALKKEVYHLKWGNDENYKDGEFEWDGLWFAVEGNGIGDGEWTSVKGKEFSIETGSFCMVDLRLCDITEESKEYGMVCEKPGCYSIYSDNEGNGKSFSFTGPVVNDEVIFSLSSEEDEEEEDIFEEEDEEEEEEFEESKKEMDPRFNKLSESTDWLKEYYLAGQIEQYSKESKDIIKEAIEKVVKIWDFTITNDQIEHATNVIFNSLVEENMKESAWEK